MRKTTVKNRLLGAKKALRVTEEDHRRLGAKKALRGTEEDHRRGYSFRNVGNVTSARGESQRARLLVSIVDSISACHAEDRGSIPRRGDLALCCRRTARPKVFGAARGRRRSSASTSAGAKGNALAGNRTRVNCLEGSYAHHYTTNAGGGRRLWRGYSFRNVGNVTSARGESQRARLLVSIVDSISACHAEDRGSIPRRGDLALCCRRTARPKVFGAARGRRRSSASTSAGAKGNALAGNRTRVNCLEGSYAHHYTTNAGGGRRLWRGYSFRNVGNVTSARGESQRARLLVSIVDSISACHAEDRGSIPRRGDLALCCRRTARPKVFGAARGRRRSSASTSAGAKGNALAGNRTRVNCLEGSYAHHYTTNAGGGRRLWRGYSFRNVGNVTSARGESQRARLLVSIVDSISACHAEDRGSIPRRGDLALCCRRTARPKVFGAARGRRRSSASTSAGAKGNALAGNRTRVNCLEGSYAHHYTTNAGGGRRLWRGCSSRNVGNVTSARGEGLRARLLVSIVDSISACHAEDRGSIPRRGGPALCCRRTARPNVFGAAGGRRRSSASISAGARRNALAGNRTRVNCLEGSYAHHYTTNAGGGRRLWRGYSFRNVGNVTSARGESQRARLLVSIVDSISACHAEDRGSIPRRGDLALCCRRTARPKVFGAARGRRRSSASTSAGAKGNALAGNRTRVNCLEGSYAHHYNTNAGGGRRLWRGYSFRNVGNVTSARGESQRARLLVSIVDSISACHAEDRGSIPRRGDLALCCRRTARPKVFGAARGRRRSSASTSAGAKGNALAGNRTRVNCLEGSYAHHYTTNAGGGRRLWRGYSFRNVGNVTSARGESQRARLLVSIVDSISACHAEDRGSIPRRGDLALCCRRTARPKVFGAARGRRRSSASTSAGAKGNALAGNRTRVNCLEGSYAHHYTTNAGGGRRLWRGYSFRNVGNVTSARGESQRARLLVSIVDSISACHAEDRGSIPRRGDLALCCRRTARPKVFGAARGRRRSSASTSAGAKGNALAGNRTRVNCLEGSYAHHYTTNAGGGRRLWRGYSFRNVGNVTSARGESQRARLLVSIVDSISACHAEDRGSIPRRGDLALCCRRTARPKVFGAARGRRRSSASTSAGAKGNALAGNRTRVNCVEGSYAHHYTTNAGGGRRLWRIPNVERLQLMTGRPGILCGRGYSFRNVGNVTSARGESQRARLLVSIVDSISACHAEDRGSIPRRGDLALCCRRTARPKVFGAARGRRRSSASTSAGAKGNALAGNRTRVNCLEGSYAHHYTTNAGGGRRLWRGYSFRNVGNVTSARGESQRARLLVSIVDSISACHAEDRGSIPRRGDLALCCRRTARPKVFGAARGRRRSSASTSAGAKGNALAGNRNRVNCLEGSYAHHYTTNAGGGRRLWRGDSFRNVGNVTSARGESQRARLLVSIVDSISACHAEDRGSIPRRGDLALCCRRTARPKVFGAARGRRRGYSFRNVGNVTSARGESQRARLLVSIVDSISACHAEGRGSIPRRGDLALCCRRTARPKVFGAARGRRRSSASTSAGAKGNALAGNRTRVNCLEGSYAHHYTTNAGGGRRLWRIPNVERLQLMTGRPGILCGRGYSFRNVGNVTSARGESQRARLLVSIVDSISACHAEDRGSIPRRGDLALCCRRTARPKVFGAARGRRRSSASTSAGAKGNALAGNRTRVNCLEGSYAHHYTTNAGGGRRRWRGYSFRNVGNVTSARGESQRARLLVSIVDSISACHAEDRGSIPRRGDLALCCRRTARPKVFGAARGRRRSSASTSAGAKGNALAGNRTRVNCLEGSYAHHYTTNAGGGRRLWRGYSFRNVGNVTSARGESQRARLLVSIVDSISACHAEDRGSIPRRGDLALCCRRTARPTVFGAARGRRRSSASTSAGAKGNALAGNRTRVNCLEGSYAHHYTTNAGGGRRLWRGYSFRNVGNVTSARGESQRARLLVSIVDSISACHAEDRGSIPRRGDLALCCRRTARPKVFGAARGRRRSSASTSAGAKGNALAGNRTRVNCLEGSYAHHYTTNAGGGRRLWRGYSFRNVGNVTSARGESQRARLLVSIVDSISACHAEDRGSIPRRGDLALCCRRTARPKVFGAARGRRRSSASTSAGAKGNALAGNRTRVNCLEGSYAHHYTTNAGGGRRLWRGYSFRNVGNVTSARGESQRARLLFSIVDSISACHAEDRGSIPRRGDLALCCRRTARPTVFGAARGRRRSSASTSAGAKGNALAGNRTRVNCLEGSYAHHYTTNAGGGRRLWRGYSFRNVGNVTSARGERQRARLLVSIVDSISACHAEDRGSIPRRGDLALCCRRTARPKVFGAARGRRRSSASTSAGAKGNALAGNRTRVNCLEGSYAHHYTTNAGGGRRLWRGYSFRNVGNVTSARGENQRARLLVSIVDSISACHAEDRGSIPRRGDLALCCRRTARPKVFGAARGRRRSSASTSAGAKGNALAGNRTRVNCLEGSYAHHYTTNAGGGRRLWRGYSFRNVGNVTSARGESQRARLLVSIVDSISACHAEDRGSIPRRGDLALCCRRTARPKVFGAARGRSRSSASTSAGAKGNALAGNRTRVNCLEGSYAHHYTTNAGGGRRLWRGYSFRNVGNVPSARGESQRARLLVSIVDSISACHAEDRGSIPRRGDLALCCRRTARPKVFGAARGRRRSSASTSAGAKGNALAGNRNRVNCLEGSYAHHYTTNAGGGRRLWRGYSFRNVGNVTSARGESQRARLLVSIVDSISACHAEDRGSIPRRGDLALCCRRTARPKVFGAARGRRRSSASTSAGAKGNALAGNRTRVNCLEGSYAHHYTTNAGGGRRLWRGYSFRNVGNVTSARGESQRARLLVSIVDSISACHAEDRGSIPRRGDLALCCRRTARPKVFGAARGRRRSSASTSAGAKGNALAGNRTRVNCLEGSYAHHYTTNAGGGRRLWRGYSFRNVGNVTSARGESQRARLLVSIVDSISACHAEDRGSIPRRGDLALCCRRTARPKVFGAARGRRRSSASTSAGAKGNALAGNRTRVNCLEGSYAHHYTTNAGGGRRLWRGYSFRNVGNVTSALGESQRARLLVSIVDSISACHAEDRGSIPRRGDLALCCLRTARPKVFGAARGRRRSSASTSAGAKGNALAGNRTRVNCLEGSYAHHYTTNAGGGRRRWRGYSLRNVGNVTSARGESQRARLLVSIVDSISACHAEDRGSIPRRGDLALCCRRTARPKVFGAARGRRRSSASTSAGSKGNALAGNRTRVNCLEGSYAHHYTTNAGGGRRLWRGYSFRNVGNVTSARGESQRARLLVSIVDSISACHAEDRGSIPRRGDLALCCRRTARPKVFGAARGRRRSSASTSAGAKGNALAGNRTRVNCLEGSYAHHYTTNAGGGRRLWRGYSFRNVGNVTSARGESQRARLLVSIVDSISACHAEDRGSIPRRGDLALCCRRTARPKVFGAARGRRRSSASTSAGAKGNALAGNRTRVNCLEGSYAHHYTTNAGGGRRLWRGYSFRNVGNVTSARGESQRARLLVSIVDSISACHADDRGSIPRRGDLALCCRGPPNAASKSVVGAGRGRRRSLRFDPRPDQKDCGGRNQPGSTA
ncbi:hypothetical protein ROHU_012966 [Labeo rohita]|uniref:Uncharacterized protein n=1 Tax=Labeo rohita TaxID=84645 RepID=A0A498LG82_LABRO|nr:hypothetical protein ROHU_012966 [Labeo rohita]